MKGLKSMLLAATATLLLGLGATAHATPISGDIAFSGGIDPATDLLTTTSLDFLPVGPGVNNAVVNLFPAPTGSFAGMGGSIATFYDFSFGSLPVTPLWAASGFSFDLTSLTVGPRALDGSSLALTGFGTISGNGYDPTPYSWSLSATRTGVVSFSATNASNASVPEPTSLLLLGSALAGLGIVRRKFGRA